MFRMENFFALNEIPDNDIATKGTEVSLSSYLCKLLRDITTELKVTVLLCVGWSPNRWHSLSRGLCDVASQGKLNQYPRGRNREPVIAGAETDGLHVTGEKIKVL